MKFRLLFSIFAFIILLSLLGCMSKGEGPSSSPRQEPPGLTVSIGKDTIKAVRGTYSWSYKNEDGTSIGVNADSVSPPGLVENQHPVEVTEETEVRLNFENPPTDYEVRIWDGNTIQETYDKIVTSNYHGKVIYEVLAEWEQGTVSYAFSLRVTE